MNDEISPARLDKLPLWAQRHIAALEGRVLRAEKTIPWTEPGMEWFTLFHPKAAQNRAPETLFVCSSVGTHAVCSLGPNDFFFVGRGKQTPMKKAVDTGRREP